MRQKKFIAPVPLYLIGKDRESQTWRLIRLQSKIQWSKREWFYSKTIPYDVRKSPFWDEFKTIEAKTKEELQCLIQSLNSK